jgi:FG-GAP repeat
MFDKSLRSKLLHLTGLALLAINAAGAQTPTLPPLTVFELDPSADDWGSFGPPTGFGTTVGISGTTAVVGVPLYALDDPTESFALELGRVAVYTQGSDGTWTRTASVIPTDRQPNESGFGETLALQNNTLIVGSSAAVRIFVSEGGTWTQTATLPLANGPVALTFDGHYLAFEASAPTGSGGSVPALLLYAYSIGAGGRPTFLGTLSPSNLDGGGIALVNGILAVHGVDSSGNGLVYVYSETSATPTVPQVLSSGEPTPDSSFGGSIAIWNHTMLVGAPGAYVQANDNTGGSFSGAAYVFTQGAHGWVQTQQIVPNNSGGFGTAVAVNQAGALISAPYSDDRYATILGETLIYIWQGNQLVLAESLSEGRAPTGTAIALSNNAAIIGTWQDTRYGFYEYADIVTLAPGGSTSP